MQSPNEHTKMKEEQVVYQLETSAILSVEISSFNLVLKSVIGVLQTTVFSYSNTQASLQKTTVHDVIYKVQEDFYRKPSGTTANAASMKKLKGKTTHSISNAKNAKPFLLLHMIIKLLHQISAS